MGRAMRILACMVDSPRLGWGVRELAAELSLAPSSVHRVLALMARHHLVARSASSGVYELDLEFIRLAHRAATRLPIPPSAMEHLRALVDLVDETGALALYDSHRRMMAFHSVIDSSKPLRYVVETDVWFPITAGASGLAILAYLPDDERSHVLDNPLPAYTENTITNPIALEAELVRVRGRGYAISHG